MSVVDRANGLQTNTSLNCKSLINYFKDRFCLGRVSIRGWLKVAVIVRENEEILLCMIL